MQAEFKCVPALLPVIETRLTGMGCKIRYADAGKMSGSIDTLMGRFLFAHNGYLLSVQTTDEGLSIQFVFKSLKDMIEREVKGHVC